MTQLGSKKLPLTAPNCARKEKERRRKTQIFASRFSHQKNALNDGCSQEKTSPKGVSDLSPRLGFYRLKNLEFRCQMTGEFFKSFDQNSG